MHLIFILIIAVSLSMDAFSLSLAYGTLNLEKKSIYLLTGIVSLFHFFMPLLGYFVGSFVFSFFSVDANFIVFIVLTFIGIQMILDSRKEIEEVKGIFIVEFFLFGFAVSIDSFSVGLGLLQLSDNLFFPAFLFAFFSGFFTYLGLFLGKKINHRYGNISTLIGGIILILIGILSLFSFL